jgi:ADP-ribosylglycohydrolase
LTLGSDLARLTHGHPTGHLTAGVLAVLIMGLCDGASLQEGLPAAISLLEAHSGHEETLAALQKAQALADTQIPAADAICQLGQGSVAEEALAISVYCALVAQSFEQGVLLAVNHDGDSDSTGAITGNLLGALHGLDAIPRHWIEKLELGDVITEVAEDLISFRDWPISSFESDDPEADAIFLKYPGY